MLACVMVTSDGLVGKKESNNFWIVAVEAAGFSVATIEFGINKAGVRGMEDGGNEMRGQVGVTVCDIGEAGAVMDVAGCPIDDVAQALDGFMGFQKLIWLQQLGLIGNFTNYEFSEFDIN